MSVLMAVGGCKVEKPLSCPPCPAGTACTASSGICEEIALEPFDDFIPGRAVRIAPEGSRIALAVIEPQTGALLVGTATPSSRAFHTLHRFGRPAGKRIALASSPRTVAVAWLDEGGVYQIATRAARGANDHWEATLIALSEQDTALEYSGSEEFDLTIDAREHVHLVFHDSRLRALRRLSRADGARRWQLETVDDASSQQSQLVCSAERRLAARLGVGIEPTVRGRGEDLYVAYHDADCGDLRLARRVDKEWVVSVVDTGDADVEAVRLHERGVVGRFPSLAFDEAGRIAVAYHDVSRGRVMYASAREGQFKREVADPGFELDEFSQQQKQLVGAFTRLVFDDSGTPRLAYMNATRTHLRGAHRLAEANGSGRWLQRTLDAQGPVGFFADQIYDASIGHIVAAERLVPTAQGLSSRLVLIWDGKQ